MEKGLIEKTGNSLAYWIEIVKKQSFEKHGEIIKFLKDKHDFTHGFANFVAHKTRETVAGGPTSDDELVNNQYKGKESLLPIYTKLITAIKSFGKDIEIVPKKGSVSLRTNKQFALIQPSTKTRIDLGLKIKDKEPEGRLESSGLFGTMCTHRMQILDASEVDEVVIAYLKEAYEKSH
jgi:predicted transport protein